MKLIHEYRMIDKDRNRSKIVRVYEKEDGLYEYHYERHNGYLFEVFNGKCRPYVNRFTNVSFRKALAELLNRVSDHDLIEDFREAYQTEEWYGKDVYSNVLESK